MPTHAQALPGPPASPKPQSIPDPSQGPHPSPRCASDTSECPRGSRARHYSPAQAVTRKLWSLGRQQQRGNQRGTRHVDRHLGYLITHLDLACTASTPRVGQCTVTAPWHAVHIRARSPSAGSVNKPDFSERGTPEGVRRTKRVEGHTHVHTQRGDSFDGSRVRFEVAADLEILQGQPPDAQDEIRKRLRQCRRAGCDT